MGYSLFAITIVLLILSGIAPHDRFTWWLEISWVAVGAVLVTIACIKKIRLTPLLQIAMFLHAVILIYGGAYTYELVPLGEWMQEFLNTERNHYDRLGHFALGFFPSVLIRELLVRQRVVNGRAWREFVIFCG